MERRKKREEKEKVKMKKREEEEGRRWYRITSIEQNTKRVKVTLKREGFNIFR